MDGEMMAVSVTWLQGEAPSDEASEKILRPAWSVWTGSLVSESRYVRHCAGFCPAIQLGWFVFGSSTTMGGLGLRPHALERLRLLTSTRLTVALASPAALCAVPPLV